MKKDILKSNIILAIQYGLGAVIPIFLMPLILKKIGANDFGIYAIFSSWALIGSVLILYVFHLTGPVAFSKVQTKADAIKVMREIFQAKILLFVIWAVLTPFIIRPYLAQTIQLSHVWYLLILTPFSSLLNNTWFLQYNNKFSTICFFSFLGTLASIALCLYLVKETRTHSNDIKMVFIFCLYNLIVGGGTFIASMKVLEVKSLFYFFKLTEESLRASYARLKVNFSLFLSQVIALGYGISGPIFIGYISGAGQAGQFSLLEKVITPLISAGLLTHTAAFPKLVKLWESDRAKYRSIIIFTTEIYMLFSASLITLYFLYENKINYFMYGNIENKMLFRAFLCWLLIAFSGSILTAYYSISQQAHKVVRMNIFTLFLVLILSIPLTFKLGALGWILGLVISHIPVLVIFLVTVFKLKVKPHN